MKPTSVFLKRFQAGIGEMFEKVGARRETYVAHTCRSSTDWVLKD